MKWKYRHNSPERWKEYRRRIDRRRHVRLKSAINEYKEQPCLDCGVQYPHYVMKLDHRDGGGRNEVKGGDGRGHAFMTRVRGMSVKRILEEIDKCDVVCSNCHEARTYKRAYPETGDAEYRAILGGWS